MESLSGKTALVTGGTGGVGKAIARGLTQRGARVIIVGRDAEKGVQAEAELRASSNNADLAFVRADLSLIGEARRLGETVGSRWPALHYLVHSAGIVRGRQVVTIEGFESNFATNYLSRFALTLRLLPSLQAAGQPGRSARIVMIAHPGLNGPIHYNDVNLTTNFSMLRAFKQFHFANDVFAVELARRLAVADPSPPSVTITCLHPGPTRTNIDKEMPLWMKILVRGVIHPLVSHEPDIPASAALRLLLADALEGQSGALFSVIKAFKRVPLSPNVQDDREGQRLWALSETLVRSVLSPPAPQPTPTPRPGGE